MRYQHELIKAQKNKNIPKYRGESFHAIELVYTYHSLSSIDIFVYFGKRLVALRWLRGRQGVKQQISLYSQKKNQRSGSMSKMQQECKIDWAKIK